jgi:nanoRNase/pAp phosphatase (c-di-AMP/oligoRNAs hydrolase)
LSGEYDIVVDLPLPKSLKTHVWIDHHRNPVQDGESEERIHNPDAKSAASLLASYLGVGEDNLVQIADRADSVSYFTEPPTGMEKEYDPGWDVNDAVKAISTSERFRELARTLALKGVASIRREFEDELSYTRNLRRRAGEIIQMISKKLREQNSDAPIIIMPSGEMNSSTVSGHIVFSLYRKGAKACAVFYEGGCWLNARADFNKIDTSEIMARFGGGGHRKSAGAPIGPEKSEEVTRELEKVGLKPLIIDLRKFVFNSKLHAKS